MLNAYAAGVFPMAERADDPALFWCDPPERGILPVGGLHVSRSMRRHLRSCGWQAAINRDFEAVIDGCADRAETWINAPLRRLYSALHEAGFAHSIAVYNGEGLIGGVYGIAIGGAFCAESMFSRRPNGSKAALIWLSDHLARRGFTLWDTQFPTPHLASLGGQTITRAAYHARLRHALERAPRFDAGGLPPAAQLVLQDRTQTS
ncbi:MAG: leucyl/phenylalanyl-tRNA--protein transferase [Paracoccus sp. (in: a-proteobacteria)]|nr:leucyl/phenylalanyl-tRNA--protein transferase [Paracoccus sp. (in: a-proteobacteria)]